MPIAPDPHFQESADHHFEVHTASNPTRRGPLRFQEGIATTDTDVPSEFARGAMQGYVTPPGRMNHNANVFEKPAEETIRERAHVGSASWPEAPGFTDGFVAGATDAEQQYSVVDRGEGNKRRRNYAKVD
ncbi:hypothetical protein ACFVGM_08950 [Kitasatospora purpeofusca]|uniref:hypothetical protein n=1 Tax=Kitasatospora purpeofusca TaxID=67352 RepID=UPI0036CD2941